MLRENGPEWPMIVFGCIGAAIHGCTMPAFAIFFSQMITVTLFVLAEITKT